ncbi:MAG: D-alanyl-D-alanine carboxypeptidase [Clostridia bacterium]|nr:D-alanyl-D-alanine carboxypeptidase [Clostridia bacterium]
MSKGLGIRSLGLLLAALLFVSLFPAPALADEYDPLYPEYLSEGHLSATSAILIEADSGKVVFEKNADERMYPASTTKILTVWLALMMAENLEGETLQEKLQTKFPLSENATNLAPDESSAKFATGEEVRLIDLCYAAMLVSGNDAATAIAEGLGGTVENYVAMMNQAAYALGCQNTHFVNANGLHDDNHYTTARDMATMARIAMQDETFARIARTDEYQLPKDNKYRARMISNGNNFVTQAEGSKAERYYEGATGIKTGTTSMAGNCLVASATRDGVKLISVVLGSISDSSRYEDTKKLMNYGFSQYISTSIAEIYLKNPRTIDIRGFALDDADVGRLKLNLQLQSTGVSDLIVTTREEMEYWAQNFSSMTVTEFTRELRAPVTEGEVMGTLTYYTADGVPIVYELTASRSIAARENLAPSVDEIIAAAQSDPNPFPRLTLELVVLYLVLPALAVFLAVKAVKAALKAVRKRVRVKAHKPTSRYYR